MVSSIDYHFFSEAGTSGISDFNVFVRRSTFVGQEINGSKDG
mgnify:CR=1 FL=1